MLYLLFTHSYSYKTKWFSWRSVDVVHVFSIESVIMLLMLDCIIYEASGDDDSADDFEIVLFPTVMLSCMDQ